MSTFRPLIGHLPIILTPLKEREGRACYYRAIPVRIATCQASIGSDHSTTGTSKLMMTRIGNVVRVAQDVTLLLYNTIRS